MTSIRRLIDRLLENWIAKVVCLLIAILLYIFYYASQIDRKTFAVPLRIEENGLVMHVGQIPNYVLVTVRTDDTIMNTINASDFDGVVDISYIAETGTYTLPVHVNLSPKLMEMNPLEVILKDDKIDVQVERKITRYVPVEPSVVGEVAHGYRIKSIAVTPSTVEISGPESVVSAVRTIPTTRITVSNAEKNFTVETALQEQGSMITVKEHGALSATVWLEVDVMEKEFTEVPVEVVYLAPGLALRSEIPTVSIILSGEVPVLENYRLGARAAIINLRDYTEPGTYEVPVRYSVLPSFTIVSKSADFITVTLDSVSSGSGGAR